MDEGGEFSGFRAVSPASSNCRGSQCSQVRDEKPSISGPFCLPKMPFAPISMVFLILQEILQRSVSVEDQRLGPSSSRAQSKTTLNELLDNLKLLEEEPERLSAKKCYHKEKYAWIDEVSFFPYLTASPSVIHRLYFEEVVVKISY